MQHIKWGNLGGEVNFEVLYLFLNFKEIDHPFIKINQDIQVLQIIKDRISYCFLYFFLNVFIYILKHLQPQRHPFRCAASQMSSFNTFL